MTDQLLVPRLFVPPAESFFLFGPRGTGKSTLMRQHFSEAIWIDLLQPDILRRFLSHPERLHSLLAGQPHIQTIVIDEIQKAPILLSVVHQLIEEKKELRFVLTGSSARKLKRQAADLLAGRALKRTLHPFMAAELNENFKLPRALRQGLLPLLQEKNDPISTLHTYVDLYLREEVYTESLVRHLENFSRFLEVISFSHASLLNITNVARECEIQRKTIENYLSILEDLLLAYTLPVFTKRAKRELIRHPKFYLFDAGIYQILRPRGPLDRSEEMNGVALEGLVAQHLKAWCDYSNDLHQLYFWRTRAGTEVDFVIYGETHFYALEVKHHHRIHSKDIKSLQTFLNDYPMATAILLYQGSEILREKIFGVSQ